MSRLRLESQTPEHNTQRPAGVAEGDVANFDLAVAGGGGDELLLLLLLRGVGGAGDGGRKLRLALNELRVYVCKDKYQSVCLQKSFAIDMLRFVHV